MKTATRIIALALVLIMSVAMLASCGNTLSGKYAKEESGTKMTFDFNGDKCTISISVTALNLSTSLDATYKIEDDKIAFTFSEDKEDAGLLETVISALLDEFSEPVPFKKGSDYIEIDGEKFDQLK